MKKQNTIKNYKLILLGILALLCAGIAACHNPIMDKWWPDTSDNNVIPTEPGPSGGSGENFAMVVFNTDGGTPQPKALKIAWGSVVGRLRPVSRSNDGFLGWFDENGNSWNVETRSVTQADDVDGDGFITLTVKWVEVADPIPIYTVKFETYPGSIISPLPSNAVSIPDQFVARDGFVVRPVEPPALPAPDNRAFAGWYTSVDYQSQWDFSFPVASNQPTNDVLTLYAKWDINIHTVCFEANGGTRPDGVTILTHEFTISLSYGLVQDPGPLVRTGFSFAGWYMEDPTFTGSPWNFNKKITDSDVPSVVGGIPQVNPLTLFAKWDRNIYNVNFVIAPSTDAAPPQQKVLHGLTVVKPADPQSGDGRGFAGWYTEETFINQWNFDNPVTSTMTLYARYVVQTRTVHFQVNGGTTSGGMDFLPNRTIFVPNGKIINPGTLDREGFTFGGWFTDPECTIAWNFDTPVTQPDNVVGEDPMYLYAKWIMNPHTVTFSIDGTQNASLTQSIIHGDRVKIPEDITNPGNKMLDGWYKNSNYTDLWDFDIDTVTFNTTLYARWLDAGYVVRYYLGTGSGASAGKIPQWDTPPGEPYLVQYYRAGDRIIEPYMPALPESDTTSWSFLRWDVRVIPSSTDVANINDPTWRNALQAINNWSISFPNYLTEGTIRVINLYARWVPPVPDMVWVPKGSFEMGDSSVSGSPAAYHAYPTRRVKVDGFYMSKYEVSEVDSPSGTIRGYRIVMGVNPSQFSKNTNRPVERVSWYDAIEYCIELTRGTGLSQALSMSIIDRAPTSLSGTGTPGVRPITNATVTPTWINPGYRLPTEAEWEYAARGGNGSPGNFTYSGSNNADDVAWYNLNVQAQMSGSQATQPVGSKQPNTLGLYDMSGNASEWCWDYFASYKDSYYSTASALTNPRGPASGTERVRRGGAWSNAVGNVRSVVRNSQSPGDATWVNGFRVVRGPSQVW